MAVVNFYHGETYRFKHIRPVIAYEAFASTAVQDCIQEAINHCSPPNEYLFIYLIVNGILLRINNRSNVKDVLAEYHEKGFKKGSVCIITDVIKETKDAEVQAHWEHTIPGKDFNGA